VGLKTEHKENKNMKKLMLVVLMAACAVFAHEDKNTEVVPVGTVVVEAKIEVVEIPLNDKEWDEHAMGTIQTYFQGPIEDRNDSLVGAIKITKQKAFRGYEAEVTLWADNGDVETWAVELASTKVGFARKPTMPLILTTARLVGVVDRNLSKLKAL
jgi:hypothetical protein